MELVSKRENDKFEIGNRIRIRREACGLSQDNLADIMGTSGRAISRHEGGASEMGIGSFFHYADSLHCAPSDLMPMRYQVAEPSGKQVELMNAIKDLSDADIEILLVMARRMQPILIS